MDYFLKIGLILVFLLSGCVQAEENQLEKVGLLLSNPIDDNSWNSKAYQGILNIQSKLDVQVFVKEDVNSRDQIFDAIESFSNEGINLVFGHGHSFGEPFMELNDKHPQIHFVVFNTEVEGDNITSLHFEGYAMGYFAGLLASEMTVTDRLGVIAAFPFQPEVEGFVEGATLNNPEVDVQVDYVYSWENVQKAIDFFHEMNKSGVDIYYPAGDGYHIAIIEKIKESENYAIGYVGDHIDLGESTVLTSTVQHVEKLYEYVANSYVNNTLDKGNLYFDFAEEVISLGEFSNEVPDAIRQQIEGAIEVYIDSGLLPHEKSGK
ncbi:BMP family ABC transporter substrate-binding protein [Evansella sp. AB-P1]|uniref:BMP family ABC transporter substrate-binding protein n=1 Tax=Evansella sp. AB-P1 TaxID=3037653 RepID=UPI00241CD9AB|nr:BMP family ABC transporter substrate-binding protein [Evansella sp. AB-P1]MDG5789155.1 BMP family ABC transporter substrate-binding protein [Evansella sp. AB-P1]